MDNFRENKIIGNIFASYLEKRLKKKYEVYEPQRKYIPDVDLILKTNEQNKQKGLFLQLKQVIRWKSTPKTPKGVRALIFIGSLFNEKIRETEDCYCKRGNNISHLILILHSGRNDYFIPSDMSLINVSKFEKSGFKGIYVVSLSHTFYKNKEKTSQKEFVFEVKSAF